MKVQLLSDLHLEFEDFQYVDCGSDVVVLAGDIHVKDRGIHWALTHLKHKTVIYVLGNHEFYGKAYPKHIQTLKTLTKNSHVHVLEKEMLCLDGVNFMGCTLWTDFSLYGDPRLIGHACQQRMNDYKKIKVSPTYRALRSLDVAVMHRQSLTWLSSALTQKKGETNVVISHHGPSEQSLPPSAVGQDVSCAYVSDLSAMIQAHQPDYWLHGHVHHTSDYYIGSCRVLCNSKGYPDALNPTFDARFSFEIT